MSAWIGELGAKAGPLAVAALRFQTTPRFVRGEHATCLHAGAAGIRQIAEVTEAWLAQESATEEDEAGFVEGSGAWLGLVLVAALDGAHMSRDGAHRVRLGGYGFFDPFAAMEAVLEADHPRHELARQLRRAEAEARGTGPIARVRRAFESALPAGDEHRVVSHFVFDVRLASGIEVSLERAVRATEDLGEGAVEQAAKKLAMLATQSSGSIALGWDVVCERVFPRLVPNKFFDEIGTRTHGAGGLHSRAFDADLRVAYVLKHSDRSRFVRRDELAAWSVGEDAFHAEAIQNLAQHSARARFAAVETPDGQFIVARTGDGLDAARLLLPSLHEVLRPSLGADIVVAVPHRDALIAAPAGKASLVEALRERASRDAERAPHRISERIYHLTPTGSVAASA